MTPEVQQIVEQTYASFAVYRPGRRINCLNREMPAEVERVLLEEPLRRLPRQALEAYTRDACAYGMPLNPWWPYFLPRYFELIARYEWPSATGAESALMCLFGGLFRDDLRRDEVRLIDAFAAAFVMQFVHEPVHAIDEHDLEIIYGHCGYEDAFAVLAMFTRCGFAVGELLRPWLADQSTTPTLHLASLVNYLYRGGHRFLAGRDVAAALATPRVHRRIDRAIDAAPDRRAEAMLRKAEQHLHDALAQSMV